VQCTIIRTTELATAEDRLADLERQKDEIMRSYSPAALLAKLQSKYSGQLHLQFLCSLRCILSSEAAHFVACIEIGYDMLHNYISTPHSCTFTNIWFSCYACTTHVYWPSGSDTAGSIIDPVLFFGCFRCKPAVEVEQRSSAISRANLLLTHSHCVGAFLRHNG
jgi:hypothetical protein